uniref:Uncharacterized protein n=1 Tax=Rhizophora mucronata TaxID=61149 RepID=A0A2P2QCC1_RHIMU
MVDFMSTANLLQPFSLCLGLRLAIVDVESRGSTAG